MEATMRRLLLSLTLALTLSAVGASSALAEAPKGAQAAPLYGPDPFFSCDTGGVPTPETFGLAVLNTPGDETTITGEVALKHATPNAEYFVEVWQSEPFFHGQCTMHRVGTITTNKEGNANLHFTAERESFASVFSVRVFRFVSAGVETYLSPAVELD
jgi:hypothetical protein